MVKSYLTREELAKMFPTVEEVRRQCGKNNKKRWGLLANGPELQFGVVSERWRLILSAEEIFAGTRAECRKVGMENVLFCYEFDVRAEDVNCYPLIIRENPLLTQRSRKRINTHTRH